MQSCHTEAGKSSTYHTHKCNHAGGLSLHLVLGLRVGSTSEEKLDQIHVAIQSSLLQQVIIRQVKVKLCTVYTPATCNHRHFSPYLHSISHSPSAQLFDCRHICSRLLLRLSRPWPLLDFPSVQLHAAVVSTGCHPPCPPAMQCNAAHNVQGMQFVYVQ